jgi:hypothetical protein
MSSPRSRDAFFSFSFFSSCSKLQFVLGIQIRLFFSLSVLKTENSGVCYSPIYFRKKTFIFTLSLLLHTTQEWAKTALELDNILRKMPNTTWAVVEQAGPYTALNKINLGPINPTARRRPRTSSSSAARRRCPLAPAAVAARHLAGLAALFGFTSSSLK